MKKQDGEGKKRVDLSEFYPGETGMEQELEIDAKVRRLLRKFKREDDRSRKRDERAGLILFDPGDLDALQFKYVDPGKRLIQKMDRERLLEAMSLLSKRQRRRVRAFYFEGLSYEQIARIEGVHRSVISRSIHKAMCIMANYLVE